MKKPLILNSINDVAHQLKNHQIGLFPFDTIWGLTCILDQSCIRRLYALKHKSSQDPLVVLLPSTNFLSHFAIQLTPLQRALIDQYWPGPNTLIFTKNSQTPAFITGQKPTIALRLPDFPPVNSLLTTINLPLISTSANLSGTPFPPNFHAISPEIKQKVDFIYHQHEPGGQQASQIIDCTKEKPIILRS
jgi:L-threonylcarbamoyladenylate synthase